VSRYVLIQSKSPWESEDVGYFYSLARDLAQAGNDVTFFLVQNGVMSAPTGANDEGFDQLLTTNAHVLADDFSLSERGINRETLKSGVSVSPVGPIVDCLTDGAKALWH